MATDPVFWTVPRLGLATIVAADASGLKDIVTGAAAGSKLIALRACSDDSSPRIIQWGITFGGTFYPQGSISVPASAGIAGVANIDLRALVNGVWYENDGNKGLYLPSASYKIQAKSESTVTAAKTVWITAEVEDMA